jgi:hypothetical protein
MHPMVLLGDEGLVELCSIRLDILLILMPPTELKWKIGDEAQVEARFSLFVDSATLDARLVHHLC